MASPYAISSEIKQPAGELGHGKRGSLSLALSGHLPRCRRERVGSGTPGVILGGQAFCSQCPASSDLTWCWFAAASAVGFHCGSLFIRLQHHQFPTVRSALPSLASTNCLTGLSTLSSLEVRLYDMCPLRFEVKRLLLKANRFLNSESAPSAPHGDSSHPRY